MEFFLDCFLPGLDRESRRASEISPLSASLDGLPAAIFTSAPRIRCSTTRSSCTLAGTLPAPGPAPRLERGDPRVHQLPDRRRTRGSRRAVRVPARRSLSARVDGEAGKPADSIGVSPMTLRTGIRILPGSEVPLCSTSCRTVTARGLRQTYRSVWVDIPSHLFDPERANAMFNDTLDELELAATLASTASASTSTIRTLTA